MKYQIITKSGRDIIQFALDSIAKFHELQSVLDHHESICSFYFNLETQSTSDETQKKLDSATAMIRLFLGNKPQVNLINN